MAQFHEVPSAARSLPWLHHEQGVSNAKESESIPQFFRARSNDGCNFTLSD